MKLACALASMALVVGCTTDKDGQNGDGGVATQPVAPGTGGTPDPPAGTQIEAAECVSAGAAYRFSSRETSGDCGPMPEETILVSEGGTFASSGCSNGPNQRSVGCDVFVDQSCPNTTKSGMSATIVTQGKVTWAKDGSKGTGFWTVTITISNQGCRSSYDVLYTRL